jgi:NADH-quinone oxidoreductase subunit I
MSEKVTIQYPEEKYSTPALARHAPHADDRGRQGAGRVGSVRRCACQLHQARARRRRERNRYPLVFEIDESGLHLFGLPSGGVSEEAIHLGRQLREPELSRDGFAYDLERLMAQTHPGRS